MVNPVLQRFLAAARDKLWTPDKEKAEGDTKLWTPGSKESE